MTLTSHAAPCMAATAQSSACAAAISLCRRVGLVLVAIPMLLASPAARAASSKGCEGGGFRVLSLSGDRDTTVPAASVGASFLVQGKYVQFEVDAASFGVRNDLLTRAPNPLDMTGGPPTPVFARCCRTTAAPS